ncbi:MAG: DUF2474 family protein [Zymomonas mobilis subsp. pomaceae]|uniref:DUF2474 domain-containing protein n=2 Tax=Zymomonas mobilis TaxID=542 RepID=F8EW20_ZYMMT|nr:hypothetical protein Zymop_1540 [Zymomonas mobilis subsp. pomaceae ATCC 29192]
MGITKMKWLQHFRLPLSPDEADHAPHGFGQRMLWFIGLWASSVIVTIVVAKLLKMLIPH